MGEKRRQRLGLRVVVLTLIVFSVLCGFLNAQPPVKVAIIPFAMNADRDLSFLQRGIGDMLATRLAFGNQVVIVDKNKVAEAISGPVDAQNSKEIGNKVGADYVLFGSLTVFGNSVSLDATMSGVKGERSPITVFNQSRGMDDVIPTINNFAQDINAKIFGRGIEAAAAPAAPKAGQTAPAVHAHPDTLLPGLGAGVTTSAAGQASGASPFIKRAPAASPFIQASATSPGFWKSPNFKEYFQGLALGDVDGDGLTETVIIGENNVIVRRCQDNRFIALGGHDGQRHQKYIWVDVADVNGNGKAEVFVSAVNGSTRKMESLVLEWNGTDLEVIAEKQKWYFAVVSSPGEAPTLYGQRGGMSDPLLSGIFRLDYEGGEYVKGPKVMAPAYVQVFGFNFLTMSQEDGRKTMGFDRDDDLKLFSARGKKEWAMDESQGGSHKHLRIPGEDKSASRVYLSQRILVTDLDSDNQPEVIVVKNQGSAGRLFKRYRKFTSAEFASLGWDGLGFGEIWRTRKISGYVADFAIGDFDNDGQLELTAAVVQASAVLGGNAKSSIISYDLNLLEKKSQ